MVPATRLAEELGKRMVLNIVMVGFFAAVTNVLQAKPLPGGGDSVPESPRTESQGIR
jgi:2-oxoglutarate ferredoxin oxidoreductase subunit gamma